MYIKDNSTANIYSFFVIIKVMLNIENEKWLLNIGVHSNVKKWSHMFHFLSMILLLASYLKVSIILIKTEAIGPTGRGQDLQTAALIILTDKLLFLISFHKITPFSTKACGFALPRTLILPLNYNMCFVLTLSSSIILSTLQTNYRNII